MKRINGLSAAIIAGAVLVSASAFADSRPQNETWRDQIRSSEGYRGDRDRGYRDNDRVTLEGRITSLDRERDGYRVRMAGNGYSFFVPERSVRSRARDFRVGVSIRLGGVFRGGSIYVDAVGYPGNYSDGYYSDGRYNDGYLRGVVERVDYRRDILVLRDERTGRFIDVDMRNTDRRSRSIDADDLRRGDVVTLSGRWVRGDFVAYRVDSVRSGGGYGRRW